MKLSFSYIFVLLAAIMSYGQVYLSSETNVREADTNDQITLTIVMEISGEDYVRESPMMLPDLQKFKILGNGSEQNTYIDPVRKISVNQIVYQLLLEPKQAGNIKIGSALVKVNGKMYKSEPFDIFVKEAGRKTQDNNALASNDVYLNVKLEEKEVYKNQPVVAVLRAYSRDYDNFRKIKNVHIPKQGNVLVQAVNYNRSDIEQGGRQDYASQVIAVFVIFPKEEGNLEMPAFSAEINDAKMSKLVSNRPMLHVKKLPLEAPEDYTNFVGNFSMSISNAESLPQPIEVNKPLDIIVKLIGKGNLSSVKMPKILETEDYSVFPPKYVKNIKTERDGIVGEIEAHYVIIPKKTGNIAIKTENFSFFNPEKKLYKDLGYQSVVINAMTPVQIASSKTTLQKVNEYTNNVLETVSTPVIETKSLKIAPNKKINWWIIAGNLALVGILSSLFLILRRGVKRKNKARLISDDNLPKIVGVEETEALLRGEHGLDIEEHLQYLTSLANQKKYNDFFKGFSDMNEEVNAHFNKTKHINFKQFLSDYHGQLVVEDYNRLVQSVEIEKYAPLHSEEEIEKILKLTSEVFSKIED